MTVPRVNLWLALNRPFCYAVCTVRKEIWISVWIQVLMIYALRYCTHTGCPKKNRALAFIPISHLNFHIKRSPRTFLKYIGLQLFKTVPTFEF